MVEQDEHQNISRLAAGVAADSANLAIDRAHVFGHHFAKTVALDDHLLAGAYLVIELHQMLDEAAMVLVLPVSSFRFLLNECIHSVQHFWFFNLVVGGEARVNYLN